MNSPDIATASRTLKATLRPKLWALLVRLAAGDVSMTSTLATAGISAHRVLCSPPRRRPLLHVEVGHTSWLVQFLA